MLVRYKQGKKFFYKSVSSRDEMAQEAIKKLARQYFNNDMESLARAITSMNSLQKECKTAVLI